MQSFLLFLLESFKPKSGLHLHNGKWMGKITVIRVTSIRQTAIDLAMLVAHIFVGIFITLAMFMFNEYL